MNEALDHKWFDRIKLTDPTLPYRFKPGNFAAAKKAFIENDTLVEPPFVYPKLHHDSLEEKLTDLHTLERDIAGCNETHRIVARLYQDKITEKKRLFELLKAAEKTKSGSERYVTLQQRVEVVYGVPDQNVFNHLYSVTKAEIVAVDDKMKRTDAYKRLQKVFQADLKTTVPKFDAIKRTEGEGYIYKNAKELRLKVLGEVEKLGLNGWRVQISCDTVGGFKVWPLTKRIIIPTTKMLQARRGDRVLDDVNLKAVVEHELHTHAVRAENGLRSPLKLLGIGLAQYWKGEEGLATYREQQIAGATDYANQRMHLAISLAYGLDQGGEARNFREVFEIMRDYFYVVHRPMKVWSRNRAFTLCERVFKGATGSGTAFVVTKDVAYREGNIAIHQGIKTGAFSGINLDAGKYDPTNESHVHALKELGIIDTKPQSVTAQGT